MKNKNLKNLFTKLPWTSYHGRQSHHNNSQTNNGQNQIKNHYVIHTLLLSIYSDIDHNINAITTPDRTITELDLSIQSGTTTEAIDTWAKSAQIEANLSIWNPVNKGAFLTKTKNNLPINKYHNIFQVRNQNIGPMKKQTLSQQSINQISQQKSYYNQSISNRHTNIDIQNVFLFTHKYLLMINANIKLSIASTPNNTINNHHNIHPVGCRATARLSNRGHL